MQLGECVWVEKSVPDDVVQVMKNQGSVLDYAYAYRRIKEFLGEDPERGRVGLRKKDRCTA